MTSCQRKRSIFRTQHMCQYSTYRCTITPLPTCRAKQSRNRKVKVQRQRYACALLIGSNISNIGCNITFIPCLVCLRKVQPLIVNDGCFSLPSNAKKSGPIWMYRIFNDPLLDQMKHRNSIRSL